MRTGDKVPDRIVAKTQESLHEKPCDAPAQSWDERKYKGE